MLYCIGRELFSGDSVNGVYSKALKRCVNDSEVTEKHILPGLVSLYFNEYAGKFSMV